MRRHLLPLLCLPLTVGCATTLNLPRASFHGMTIQTVQPDPDDERLELEVGVDFKVDNPLGFRLVVPEHTFGLSIDGAPATSTGVHQTFEVKSKKHEVVTYALRLDPVALGKALGREATFSFRADVDVDVADALARGVGDVLGGAAAAATEGVARTASSGASGDGSFTLSFEHAGKLKVPKVPKVRPPADGDKAGVQLVGESTFLNLDEALGELRGAGGPVVDLLAQVLGQAPQQNVSLPARELLEALGVPANLVEGALGAVNTFLRLNGRSAIRSSGSDVTLPVKMPRLDQVIAAIDPQAATKIDRFTQAWAGFSGGSLGGASGLAIPTSLPSGLRVTAPFTLNNPNEFAVNAPMFRLGLVDGEGRPLLLVGTLPTAEVATTDLSTRRVSHQAVEGSTDTAMSLVSEIHWDELTGGLLKAAAAGVAVEAPAGLRLVGEITVDPGYGPITVPLNVSLAPKQDAAEE